MEPDERGEQGANESEHRGACDRAQSCSGWLVTRSSFVQRCEACAVLADEDEAHLSARAAGLDVRRDGFVVGIPGVGRPHHEPRSEAHRATVSANDLLVGVLEQLQDVLRLDRLPPAFRSSVDYLAIEVAKVQGVSEWVAEDLVWFVGEKDKPDLED